MKKYFFIALFSIFCIEFLYTQIRPARVPATPHPIEVLQPNGEKLTIRLHGDERKHYTTTIDGFVIMQNIKGFYCYAKINKNGNYKPTKKIAHNKENRKKNEEKFLKKQMKKEKLYYKLNK
jgi:hypothetical protein